MDDKNTNRLKMRNCPLVIWAVLAVALFVPVKSVQAQLCDTLFEVITTLKPPTFGFPTVWDSKFGDRDVMTQMVSGVPQEGGTVFTLSRTLSAKDYSVKEIVLADINRRGRALKEARYPAKNGEDPVKMIQIGESLIALSNIRQDSRPVQKQARIAWYDKDGKYKKDYIIKDAVFDYDAMGLTKATDDDGFTVILKAVNRSNESDMNGVLMRFTKSGTLLWRRAYRPGIPNMLYSVVPFDGKSYIAVGQIRLDDGRMAGWAMKLGYDGAIHWQRTYPRGMMSAFKHAATSSLQTSEGAGFLLAGYSEPYDDGNMAAWVMEVDALGEPQWQRYFRRDDYDFTGDWILREPDGRMVLIVNADLVDGEDGRDHIRMVTMSPRGVLIMDEGYYEGLEARATDYAEGWNGERIVTAIIEDDMQEHDDPLSPVKVIGLASDEKSMVKGGPGQGQPQKPMQKGWVFVATALDPYDDPCASLRGR